jgi:hypothetical protein
MFEMSVELDLFFGAFDGFDDRNESFEMFD